jgi:hypothetical protein
MALQMDQPALRNPGGILLAHSRAQETITNEGTLNVMFSRVRIAIRFFFVGLAVGVLLAPRSGEETRRLVREKADRLLNDILDAATLGTYESGAGSLEADDEAPAPTATRTARSRSRSGNGASRGAKASETSATTAGT